MKVTLHLIKYQALLIISRKNMLSLAMFHCSMKSGGGGGVVSLFFGNGCKPEPSDHTEICFKKIDFLPHIRKSWLFRVVKFHSYKSSSSDRKKIIFINRTRKFIRYNFIS